MKDKIHVLLEQLKIDGKVDALYSAMLSRVYVDQENNFQFFISSEKLLPFDEYFKLNSHRENFPYPVKFEFECVNEDYDKRNLELYLGYFINEFSAEFPSFSNLSLKNIEIKDSIRVKLFNELILDQSQAVGGFFKDRVKAAGISLPVEFVLDVQDQDYQELIKEMTAPIEVKAVIQPRQEEAPAKPARKNYYSYSQKNATKYRLDEINAGTMEPNVVIEGYIFAVEEISTRKGTKIQTLKITDYTSSIIVKWFENKSNSESMKVLSKGKVWVQVFGEVRYDDFAKETIIFAKNIEIIKSPKPREDLAKTKRVELSVHSKMSAMDAVSEASEYISRAISWGHSAIAITDRANVQAFPECQSAARDKIKILYGVEFNMYDPEFTIVHNVQNMSIEDATYVSFDLETTGLSVVHDGITEFGAVKIRNGEVVDRLQFFVNPQKPIPSQISQLTNITNAMVKDEMPIEQRLEQILEFFGDAILVAHNAPFDIGFLNEALMRNGYSKIVNPVIDTLNLCKAYLKSMKSYRLGQCCRVFRITYDDGVAHRADYDAEVLGHLLNVLLHQFMQSGKYNLEDIAAIEVKNLNKLAFANPMSAIALNKDGLKNMFKAVSESNTIYLHGTARIPQDRLEFYHEGILYGSGPFNSNLFEAALNKSDEQLYKAMQFYDYIEINPLEDYYHIVDRGRLASMDDVKKSILRVIKMADELGKIVVATGDVHFLDQKDKLFRDVFISNPSIGLNHRAHYLCARGRPDAWTPNQMFRTTDEMLEAFKWLGEDLAYKLVVENTNYIASLTEVIKPVHDKLFTPKIEGADENLTKICYDTAHEIYGENLPEIVEKRLEKELNNIIKHGFGVIYYISHLLVKKSNEDGYLVGSRGSVGSSFVATMSNITEVNPLPPHYVCYHCNYSEFIEDGSVASGYDLPDKKCPVCGQNLKGEGHNIPFETFLGFNADKVPDIDLNFSGEYQPQAHEFTKEIFGVDNVFRAGTISTVAAKTAYGYAKGYAELLGKEDDIRSAELERIAQGCQGVKRTTGQHPGGIIVIPNYMDVYDFTPIQFPADDLKAAWRTTHFDFHAIHDNVLKLDILGHVDPTVIRALQDLTGIDPKTIPTNDEKVMKLFTSTESLGIDLSYINVHSGVLGLPEFGTSFVRGMLKQTQPNNFNDLVIISGLSHGTDVYLGNAEKLIKEGTCTLSEVIGCRDDIMTYLIDKQLPNKDAFDIMECVRKGKSPKVFPEKNYEQLMKDHNVPQWYIDSCKKIKYMFPKAHAVAYVLSAIRVAWWKVYYPREYYAVYLSTRCDFFEIDTMVNGKDAIIKRHNEIAELKSSNQASNKEIGLYDMFEIALEMIERGYHLNPVSLKYSSADRFILDPEDEMGIIPPFSAIDALGANVAKTVVEARSHGDFISKEDVIKRTKLNNSHVKTLENMGVFGNLQERNQMSLF